MSQADSFIRQWMSHRSVLVDLADKFGDDHADFRPWDGAMSVSEMFIHTAWFGKFTADSVKGGAFGAYPTAPKAATMAETRELVRNLTEETKSVIAQLSDEQMESVVDAMQLFKFSAPGKIFLHVMRDHDIHHKGQLFVYARLLGLKELPFFVGR